MIFVSLLAFSAGYFLNEAKSLDRLCSNLGYTHEGWLVLHYQRGFFIYLFFVILAFVKSWGWGLLLKNSLTVWYFPAGGYLLGNMLAIYSLKKGDFTFWCALAGILLGVNKAFFQIPFTAVVVCYLITREKFFSLQIGKIALVMTMFIFFLIYLQGNSHLSG